MAISGYAYYAGVLVHAYCRQNFPDRGHGGADMACTVFTGGWLDCFDIRGTDTHKYFDADAVTEHLGMKKGSGVYGRVVFSDSSVLYLTCDGRLAKSDACGTAWID